MSLESIRQIDGLNVEQGLKNCMDDEDLYRSVLEMYITQLQGNLPELDELFQAQDWAAYGRTCHAIKGASASVGAANVMSFSATLEAAGREDNDAIIRQQHGAYSEQLQSTIDELTASL